MERNDYFYIVFVILDLLYRRMKYGMHKLSAGLSPATLGIPESYWEYIVKHLKGDGFISDIIWEKPDGGVEGIYDAQITPKGIAFLMDSRMMHRARKARKKLRRF